MAAGDRQTARAAVAAPAGGGVWVDDKLEARGTRAAGNRMSAVQACRQTVRVETVGRSHSRPMDTTHALDPVMKDSRVWISGYLK